MPHSRFDTVPFRSAQLETVVNVKRLGDRLLVWNNRTSATTMRKMAQMTEREIRAIEGLAPLNETILEFGAGYSTAIWANTFSNVVAVEARAAWHDIVCQLTQGRPNVQVLCFPPEACAYRGNVEAWTTRDPSDYGTVTEFASYFAEACALISRYDLPNTVLLIDGMVRAELLEYAANSRWKGTILLHDVTPERAYLNEPVINHQFLQRLWSVDSLAAFSVVSSDFADE